MERNTDRSRPENFNNLPYDFNILRVFIIINIVNSCYRYKDVRVCKNNKMLIQKPSCIYSYSIQTDSLTQRCYFKLVKIMELYNGLTLTVDIYMPNFVVAKSCNGVLLLM